VKVYKPKVVPEFHMDPTPRVLYTVRLVSGMTCNCNDVKDAIRTLDDQCKQYLRFMQMFANEARNEK